MPRTTPERVPHSLNIHTTPTAEYFTLNGFNMSVGRPWSWIPRPSGTEVLGKRSIKKITLGSFQLKESQTKPPNNSDRSPTKDCTICYKV
ncbi:hypothetical protein AVEN_260296-1 [Araneus ventricosus]|uniref:Uncharacterized protein n=1 Tax=Araneus ventricosus TaxID=182803 RepID=A0A4Y2J226_ARAVE|nr:hypothetical protein AVEN_260296-1 [Araneus ventricosus]